MTVLEFLVFFTLIVAALAAVAAAMLPPKTIHQIKEKHDADSAG